MNNDVMWQSCECEGDECVKVDEHYPMIELDTFGMYRRIYNNIQKAANEALNEAIANTLGVAYGGPVWPSGTMCETCHGFIPTGEICRKCLPEGMTKCPADSPGCMSEMSNAEKCVLCGGKGFVEALND